MVPSTCPFCDLEAAAERDRFILREGGFDVIATVGQIGRGHVLLVPRAHVSCLGAMAVGEIKAAARLKERLAAAIASVYGRRPVVFEHGNRGQSVRHAHLHLLAGVPDFFAAVARDFPRHERASGLEGIKRAFREEGGYLFYEGPEGAMTVFRGVDDRPQYFRRRAAEALGRPELADWRQADPVEDGRLQRETTALLRGALGVDNISPGPG